LIYKDIFWVLWYWPIRQHHRSTWS